MEKAKLERIKELRHAAIIFKELVVGSFYNVEEVSMGQSSPSIKLYGMNYGFNSVMFEFYKDGKEHDIFDDPEYNPYLPVQVSKTKKKTDKIIMKNWSVCTKGKPYMAPEIWTNYLYGNVYGHPRFKDGDLVSTSSIVDVKDGEGYKIVSTRNTDYILYESDVSSDYESKYPNAYSRLSMTMM